MNPLSLCLLLSGAARAETIFEAFPPPREAERVAADPWGTWLQSRPLAKGAEPVRTWDGRVVAHQGRVVELPLVDGDLQQCADSLIRLRAEWLREQGLAVVFHATSGDRMPWSRYQAGERAAAVGRGLQWSAGHGAATWEEYLRALFTWAGTRSLQAYDTHTTAELSAGRVLVRGGSPGHAVVLLDVAKRGEESFVLVGEGFMPAQDFHVELGPHQGWWRWEPGLDLPYWDFEAADLRSF